MKVVNDDYRLVVKRLVDVVGAAVGLVLLSPLILVIAAAVKLTSPGPVFFAQERYGWRKRRFKMYKFRTMVTNAEALQPSLESRNEVAGPVFKIANDPRQTRIGAFLRRSSLDELPQLWNVLRLVACRAGAGAGARRRALLRRLAHAPVQRRAGADGALAGERAEQPRLRAVGAARPALHRPVVAGSRLRHSRQNPAGGAQGHGCQVIGVA
jgi:hypothetical protein